MTYNEFESLATSRIGYEGETIFVLSAMIADYDPEEPYKLDEDGSIISETIWEAGCAYFHSVEDAERCMRESLEDGWRNVHCFYLREHRVGAGLECCDECMSCRLYDYTGKLVDSYMRPSYFNENQYYGRPEDKIRFKAGDIVEVRQGVYLSLAIIYGLPPTVKNIWHRYGASKSLENIAIDSETLKVKWPLDSSDDCYIVLDDPDYMTGHSHPDCLNVYAPRYPVPDDIRQKLIDCLDSVKNKYDKS